MGRPSDYSPEVAQEICDRLSQGEPLAAICRDDHMPAVRTVSDWKAAHPTFSADFAHAREAGFDQIALDCLEIADDTRNDTKMVGRGEDKHEAADTEWISRSKLRVETRLKLLAKWDPKRYGDRVALTDGDGGKLAPTVVMYQLPDNGRD
ncbi:hypothetical protein A4249_07095 [Brevundimonas sp. GW460-12-10-14-LB2]|uniref:terminase small subunit-like protein n=1 Tax=Brevundimonas sp. GW460-12-10-14-LB2 TaxID=1827469 RepID=UPI0007BC9BF7|nr:hypothetical protein [Brevundimonas sp. GW460-12-10-14-LB2]ANC53444.1 hypothetical protein A4249_07095 [Brevundimonas sp. GW460-12-10-14-LB2]